MDTPSRSAVTRRRDAAVAGHTGDAAGARLYLADPDPMVRSSALRGLDRAGGLTGGELEAALGDPEPAVRMTGLELAAGRRDVPVAAVAALLADEDRRVVEAAAWACGERGGESGSEHRTGAGHQTAGHQTAGHQTAGHQTAGHQTAGHQTAGQTAGHQTAGHQTAGHKAAGHEAAGMVEALVRVAGSHIDPLCRESAVAALGAIADPAGLPAILAGLDDKPEVRRRAVIALAPFDGPEVDAALARAAVDRDKQVRAAAAELLGL